MAPRDATPEEGVERSVAFTLVGQRANVFPAADVVIVMERSLVRRVAARLLGDERRSVRYDNRRDDASERVGGVLRDLLGLHGLPAAQPRHLVVEG